MSSPAAVVVPDGGLNALCELPVPEMAGFIERHPALVKAESVVQLADIVRRSLRSDVNVALRAGEAACAVAERLGTPECLATALRAKANALWFKGQYKPAVELLNRAATLFEAAGRLDELGRTLSTSIQPLILLGDYDAAYAAGARARQLFESQADEHRLARLELNIANIFHRQERFVEAQETYERAYRRLLPYSDAEGIAVALHNMAVCLISLDDFERALNTYTQAREFFETHSMPVLVSQADYNIAYLHYLRGDYERALTGLAAARESCRREGDDYHAALCDLDESEIYLDLNMTPEAAELAQSAMAGFAKLSTGYERGRAAVNAAIAACRMKKRESAAGFFAQAKEAFAAEKHEAGQALVDLYVAVLLAEMNKCSEARRLCLAAASYFASNGLIRKKLLCDLLLARLDHADGDLDMAGARCDEAIEQLRSIQAPALAYQAFMTAAHISEARGDEPAAFRSYREARGQIEGVRTGLHLEELKIAFMSSRVEVYTRLVQLCLIRGVADAATAEYAFNCVEGVKSRSLMDSIVGLSQPHPALPVDPETSARVEHLRGQLNWCYRRIEREQLRNDGIRPDRIAALWEQARECETAILKLRRFASESHTAGPQYEPSVLEKVRAALGPDSVLIEYFQTENQMVAAVVSQSNLSVVPLAPVREVQAIVNLLLLQLSKFRLGPKYLTGLEQALHGMILRHLASLYRCIIDPLRHLLADAKHLIFAPHGVLHYVPMPALYGRDGYLADLYTISYSPSAALYAHTATLEVPGQSGSLVIAQPDLQAPWITREAEEVSATLADATTLVGEQATREAIEALAPTRRLIHIATHGVFRRDSPMFSRIKLGDSFLTLYDLYRMKLPVDLVTFSGCATGLNVIAAGDEVMGMARGLLYAGARSLLLTLWDVNDRSTAQFMCSFYRHLEASGSKAAAVRAAMLELRAEYPHPYYWAPFALIGRP